MPANARCLLDVCWPSFEGQLVYYMIWFVVQSSKSGHVYIKLGTSMWFDVSVQCDIDIV